MTRQIPLVYVVACEPSGDELGAKLIVALRAETKGAIAFAGVGGRAMTEVGLTSLFDPSDLALIGIFEVLPKAALVLRRVGETVADIVSRQPDILVTIDSWGFTGRVHQRLARMRHPAARVRYVAPQVWAWRPGRARQLARWIHHLMTLLPFEPPYFQAVGLPATWVGHPVIESGADRGDAARFKAIHGIVPAATVLCILPGSRRSEVSRLLPVFGEVAELVAAKISGLVVVVPTVPNVDEAVRNAVAGWACRSIVVSDASAKYDAFAASTVALAASGTVTLELALAGVPHVIGYRVNSLTAWIVKRALKTRFANLINVLLDRMVVRERLQGECRADLLFGDVMQLLSEPSAREAMNGDFAAALSRLAPKDGAPSRVAARAVLSLIGVPHSPTPR